MPRISILGIEVFGEQIKVQMPRLDEIFYFNQVLFVSCLTGRSYRANLLKVEAPTSKMAFFLLPFDQSELVSITICVVKLKEHRHETIH